VQSKTEDGSAQGTLPLRRPAHARGPRPPALPFFSRPRRAALAGAALLGAVVLMALVVPAEPLAIDGRWFKAMQDIQGPALTKLALAFDALGRGLGWALSLAAVAVVLSVRRRRDALLVFTATEALASVGCTALKILVGRPRPDGLVSPLGSSFPSGHAAYAGATCVALVLLFTESGARRRPWWALAALGVIGMAWSRTYLQVHWLSDVVGGSLLGVGAALAVFGGAQRLWVPSADSPSLLAEDDDEPQAAPLTTTESQ